MEFNIPSILVPCWRGYRPPEAQQPASAPMSEQIWTLLDAFESREDVYTVLYALKQIDAALHPDASIDANEWDVAGQTLDAGIDTDGPKPKIKSTFAILLAENIARARGEHTK